MALADSLILVLIVLILAVVDTRLINPEAKQRAAIAQFQNQLLGELGLKDLPAPEENSKSHAFLVKAAQRKEFICCFQDGDLQRFWLNGRVLYPDGGTKLSSHGAELIRQIGNVLARHQGEYNVRTDEVFKYILVEGHANSNTRNTDGVEALADARAKGAAKLLGPGGGVRVSKFLIRAYGRSYWDPGATNFEPSRTPQFLDPKSGQVAKYNDRIEIVVVYSGDQVLKALAIRAATKTEKPKAPTGKPQPKRQLNHG